jgi:glycerol-3-phosphate O-acyltransferase / dihydroxyacetone phosphate acyltransferase
MILTRFACSCKLSIYKCRYVVLQWRILVPSASVPPSTGTPGMWRRKSGTGAVDAQGNLLIHPMVSSLARVNIDILLTYAQTWIDERLFGWSRSAKHGTSAWGGGAHDVSHAGTPDETDEEDGGDYDDVIELIPGGWEDQLNSPRTQKSRSRQGSYADLQKLRMSLVDKSAVDTNSLHVHSSTSSTSQSPATEVEGLHFRHRHRDRRMSLSDQVSVERIAAVDPKEAFGDATHEINDEINQRKPERGYYE